MAYFERVGPHEFRATSHVGGAWDIDTQHIAPALGVLAHAVEMDRDERSSWSRRRSVMMAGTPCCCEPG